MEQDFWEWLEMRVTAEFTGSEDRRLRSLWCDGFIPEHYALDSEPPMITGRVWIGNGPRHQDRWTFTLLLLRRVSDLSAVEWSRLLPPSDTTGWFGPNQNARHLDIEPAAALPDDGV